MERFSIKSLIILFCLLMISLGSLEAQQSLSDVYTQIDQLPARSESNLGESQLLETLAYFFKNNDIRSDVLAYRPSSLVQSFSYGRYVRILGSSPDASAFFVFPLDQREGSSHNANNAGIYTALEAILTLQKSETPPERTLYFVFLGAELTRDIPVGSLFLLQNAGLSFKNSLFYYFEVSNLKNWEIYTRGERAYYATPEDQLRTFLESLALIPSLKFEVMDSFPLKNIFQEHENEPFETYSTLSLPFVQIKTPITENNLSTLEKELSRVIWGDFYRELAQIPISNANLSTNQYYLYFHLWQWFTLIDSSYYLIFILLLANFITFTGFRQIKVVSERMAQTLRFNWYFLFLFFLFFLSLISTSYLFPYLTISYEFYQITNWLLALKVAFACFLSFSFLYLAHPTLGYLPKQSYLYMALFTFLFLAGLATFYNILSSFFFLVSAIFVFLGIVTTGGIRLFFNVVTFLWLLFTLIEGVDNTWLSFFLRAGTNVNLLLSASLFPYLLLFLSYTTPNQKILERRFSRSLFSKMQTTLLLSFSFTLIFMGLSGLNEKPIPIIDVLEEWKVGEPYPALSFVAKGDMNLRLSSSRLETLRTNWLIADSEIAPKNLSRNHLLAETLWLKTLLFKRQDYHISLSFPFPIETLETTIAGNNSGIPPIVYRSELPYEINDTGDIKFTTGPNPPQKFAFSFSLDEAESLKLNLAFTSPRLERTDLIFINKKPYRLFWRQRVIQNAGSSSAGNVNDNPLEVILGNDPDIKRLRQLKLPEQRLLPR